MDEVIMPALGAGQETGTLIQWLVAENSLVDEGSPLMLVETEKSTFEIDAPATGYLVGVSISEGDEVPVGTVIAHISGEPSTDRGSPGAAPPDSPGATYADTGRTEVQQPVHPAGAVAVIGDSSIRQSSVWRRMSKNTLRSWQAAPHFFLLREVNAKDLVTCYAQVGRPATITDYLIAVVSRVTARHPLMRPADTPSDAVNIGLAVAIEDGLVVPVIRGANTLSIAEIAEARATSVTKARTGALTPDDVSGSDITISNLGMHGVDHFFPIVANGQVSTIAFGRIAERVLPLEGRPAVAKSLNVSVSADHSLVDGSRAAAFLSELASELENHALLERLGDAVSQ